MKKIQIILISMLCFIVFGCDGEVSVRENTETSSLGAKKEEAKREEVEKEEIEKTGDAALRIKLILNEKKEYHITGIRITVVKDEVEIEKGFAFMDEPRSIAFEDLFTTFEGLSSGLHEVEIKIYKHDTLISVGEKSFEVIAGETTNVDILLEFLTGDYLNVSTNWVVNCHNINFDLDVDGNLLKNRQNLSNEYAVWGVGFSLENGNNPRIIDRATDSWYAVPVSAPFLLGGNPHIGFETSLTINFTDPVNDVSFYVVDVESSDISADFKDSDGNIVDTVIFRAQESGNTQKISSSKSNIHSITLNANESGDEFFIDDLYYCIQ